MAIYHLSAQVISRSSGRSVVNAAAYRAAEKVRDERLDKTFAYERKQGVEHREILAPDGAPPWATDRAKLWNAVEAAENRRDAQLAREVNVALPVELSKEQQLELLRGYVREQFVARGMVADICIHRDNPKHPHAHILLTTREIGSHGFSAKQRAWNDKGVLLEWRSEWANCVNRSLDRAGLNVRIDHRSYNDQGIELEPQSKIGTTRERNDGREIVRERMIEHQLIAYRNGQKILRDPSIALSAITHQRATFTQRDVGCFLNTHTINASQFQACFDKVMAARELVLLGKDARGQERYTTREMLEIERRLVDTAQTMAEKKLGHAVEERYQRQAEIGRNLSADQRAAFVHILKSGDCAVVQGYAGAGKSYMLGAARESWEAQGYRVVGGALAGKAAEGLQQSAGIESRSLHSWEYAWSKGREHLTKNDVLVVDEAGMVGSRQLERVMRHAHDAGAKIVLVGDTRQLQAIEAGAPMRMVGERVGQVTMSDIRRQGEDWQKVASVDLANGKVEAALDAYGQRGYVHEHAAQADAKKSIVDAWDAHRKERPGDAQIILAYRRVDVRELNELARQRCRDAGALGPDHRITTEQGERNFASGDRVYFLKNDRQLGVLNGTLGQIESIKGSEMVVRLDDGRRVAFDTQQYAHLDHGYAGTVHKGQGVTVDRAHVLAGQLFDQHAAYVGLTRHRDQVDLHWSREEFANESEMRRVLGRERPKDVALDYERAEQRANEMAKGVGQLEKRERELAKAEDREQRAKAEWRDVALLHGERADKALQKQGPDVGFCEKAAASAQERQQLERAMASELRVKLSEPSADERREGQWPSLEQRLEEASLRSYNAHKAWAEYRDKAPLREVVRTRCGVGPGAPIHSEFRDARACADKLTREFEAQKKERLEELSRPKPELPFSGSERDERWRRLVELDPLSRQKPIDFSQASLRLPEWQKLTREVDDAKEQVNRWDREVQRFEADHPFKAKLGLGVPSYADRSRGVELSIYGWQQRAREQLSDAERRYEAMKTDPEVARRIRDEQQRFNSSIEGAKREMQELRQQITSYDNQLSERLRFEKNVQQQRAEKSRSIEALASCSPITEREALARMPEMRQLKREFDGVRKEVRALDERVKVFESLHPDKARPGVEVPRAKEAVSGRDVSIYDARQATVQRGEHLLGRLNAMVADPEFLKRLGAERDRFNADIQAAKQEFKSMFPGRELPQPTRIEKDLPQQSADREKSPQQKQPTTELGALEDRMARIERFGESIDRLEQRAAQYEKSLAAVQQRDKALRINAAFERIFERDKEIDKERGGFER